VAFCRLSAGPAGPAVRGRLFLGERGGALLAAELLDMTRAY